jgi:hypothetical protein
MSRTDPCIAARKAFYFAVVAGSRNPSRPPLRGRPLITPKRGIELLSAQIKKAEELLANQTINQNDFRSWDNTTRNYIEKAFGENHPNVRGFEWLRASINTQWGPAEWADHYAKRLDAKIEALKGYIDELKTEIVDEPQVTSADFFAELDADVRRVSEQLFKNGHHAEAVSAAFKELNHQVKQEYRKRKNVELVQ